MPSEASHQEYMVVSLARHLRDHEWGACGAYSEIPMAAFRLARRMHAPNLWWMSGGGGAINPECELVESSSSFATHASAEAFFTIEDIVDYEFGGWQRKPNVGLFGGIQVDREGSVNMIGIGEYPNLALRGPGTVGLAFAAHFNRTMIYLHDHNERVLCEKVDYVSAPGRSASRREHVRSFSKGPEYIVTPQAVFGFDAEDRIELKSMTPGYSVEDVRAHTGFEFGEVEGLAETAAPSAEELEIIHTEIDPRGALARVSLGTW